MSVSISGILLDPFGQPASFAEVKFITWQGANDVLTTAPAVFKTSAEGAYSFAVEFGTFTVQVRYNQSNGKFQTIKQKVVVNSNVTATTLGELLLFNEPLTPPEIAYVEQLVAEAEGYKDDAAASAAASEASSQSSATSAAASAQSATDAANSAALIAPVPLNGGVWASGQTYDFYNQYMIYNGEAYSPLPATALPYTVGAVPDLGFVYQIKLNSLQALSGLTEPSDLDEVYSRTFDSVADMLSSTALTEDQSVKTLGYYSAGDGGEGRYIVINKGAVVPDELVDFSVDASLMLKLQYDEFIDIKQGGAKASGGFDDTPFIQNLLDRIAFGDAIRFSGFPRTFAPLYTKSISRGCRLFAEHRLEITCAHNSHGIVMNFASSNYGRYYIDNLYFVGPNDSFPPVSYVPPNTGAGIFIQHGFDNVLTNCSATGFGIGIHIARGFSNKVLGNSEFLFNQIGGLLQSEGNPDLNINLFEGAKFRENRIYGVQIGGAVSASPLTSNRFTRCYIESNTPYAGGVVVGHPTDGSASVGVYIDRAYNSTFRDCYMENHGYAYWITNSASRNKFFNMRHDYSGDNSRQEKIHVGGTFCVDNEFHFEEYAARGNGEITVEISDSTSSGTTFKDCTGITFDPPSMLALPYISNNKKYAGLYGTAVGLIQTPPQGYFPNPTEGTAQGKIDGIGTLTATVNCQGAGEVSFQSAITAPTTVTTLSNTTRGQLLVLWNHQPSHAVTIKSTSSTGNLYLKGGVDVVFTTYGQMLVLYVNGLNRAIEIGRSF